MARCFRRDFWGLLFALTLLFTIPWSAWAQPIFGVSKDHEPSATLTLQIQPSNNSAGLSFNVLGGKLPAKTEAEANTVLKQPLTAAFGKPVPQIQYLPLTEDDESDEDEAEEGELPSKKPVRATTSEPIGWMMTTGVGGNVGGPLQRNGLLQAGSLDLKPIFALLKSLGIEVVHVNVRLVSQGAPTLSVTGIDSQTDPTGRLRQNNQNYSQTFRIDSPPAEPIRFVVGWTVADLARTYVPLIVLLLLPLLLAFVLRTRALKAQDQYDESKLEEGIGSTDPRAAIWLGCFRLLHHGTVAFSLIWVGATLALKPDVLPRWAFDIRSSEIRTALSFLMIAVPPALIPIFGTVILRPVFARLKNTDITITEIVLQAGGNLVLSLLSPLFFWIGVSSLLERGFLEVLMLLIVSARNLPEILLNGGVFSGVFRGFGWFALGGVMQFFMAQALPLINRLQPVLLTEGKLRDRIFALAEKVGVKVSQAVYLPTGWDRMANAFAVKGNLVVLTDRLLDELSRREVDGVIAHELAHLKYRHPFWLGVQGTVSTVLVIGLPVLISITGIVPASTFNLFYFLYVPVMIGLGMLIRNAISRRWEEDADKLAAKTTGDSAALITGLVRLSRINGAPEEWNRFEERLVTHPSTQRRAAYLAAAGGLDTSELEQTISGLREAAAPEERYPLPAGAATPNAIFSPLARQRQIVANSYVALAILTGIPGLIAFVVERFFPRDLPLVGMAYLVGAALTLVVYLTYMDRQSLRTTERLEARLRARMREAGLIPQTDENVLFVGLVPAGPTRYFDGRPDIDRGYLVLEPDAVRFVGENVQFTIPRTALVAPFAAGQAPGWFPYTRVALAWADPENNNTPTDRTTIILHTYDAQTVRGLKAAAVKLLARLQTWYTETTPEPTDEPLRFTFAIPVQPESTPETEKKDLEIVEEGEEEGTEDTDEVPELEAIPVPALAVNGGVPTAQFRNPVFVFGVMRPFLLAALAAGFLSGLPLRAVFYMLVVSAAILITEVFQLVRQSK